jgi:MYXO-CTERM domain-containing protein
MRLATILAVCLVVQTTAGGGTIMISGFGTWDGTVSSSSGLTAPGATWSFSLDVPDPLVTGMTSQVTDSSYSLNGTPIHDTITSVEFYGRSAGGLFDMTFASGGTVAFYGAQIVATNHLLIPGTYPAMVDDDHSGSFLGPPYGEGHGTVIVGTAVPEPATRVDAGIALATLAGLGLHRRRRIAARSRSRRRDDSRPGA